MRIVFSIYLILISLFTWAQKSVTFAVQGITRTAVIAEPTLKTKNPPILLVYHGHYGNANNTYKRMAFHNHFPEAVVVYMNGLPGTPSMYDKAGKGNGWQIFPGQSGDRDLIFTDTVVAFLKRTYHADSLRIYAAGHSNGARFVHILWKERPQYLAAGIAVAAQGGMMIRQALPRSMWMSIGKNDPLVSAEGQLRSVPIALQNIQASQSNAIKDGDKTIYKGINNTELIVQLRDAGHEFPIADIPDMVAFLKRHHL